MVERINFRIAVRGAAQAAAGFNSVAAAVQSVNTAVAATAKGFAKNSSVQAAASGASTVQIVNNYKTVQASASQAAAAEEALARKREKELFLTNQSLGKFLDKQRAQREKDQSKRVAGEEATAKKEKAVREKAAAAAVKQAASKAKRIEAVESASRSRRIAQTTAFLGRLHSLATTVGSATVRALASIGTIGPSLRRSLGAIETQLNQFGRTVGRTFVGQLVSAVTKGFAVIPKLIGQLVGPITSSIGIIVKAAGASFTALGSTIGSVLSAAFATVNPILGATLGVATSTMGAIIGTFQAGAGSIIQIFGGVLEGVGGVFSGLVTAAGGAVARVADLLGSIANQVFTTVGNLVTNTVGQVVSSIGGLFGKLGGIVESGLRTIFSPIGLIIGGLSIKAAADIRDKVVNTFALLDDRTQASVDAVTNRLSELATRVGVPVAQVGDLFFNVVSAGFRELGGAIEVLERAAELAVAGSARVQDTGKNLITLLAATKAPAEAAGKAAQFFFDVQDRGVITIQELSTSFPDLVSAIIAAKLPLEEVGALFSVLTREGQSASETATQLQQVILNLVAPIPQARQKMKALGLEIHELTETDEAVISGLENQIIALEDRNSLLEGGSAAARENAKALESLNQQLATQIEVRGKFVGITEALSRIKQLLRELDAEDTKVSRSIVSRIRAVKGLTFLADNIERVRKETTRIGQSPDKFIDAIDLANQKVGIQIQKTIGELRQLGIAIFRLGATVTGGSGFETVRQAIRGLRGLIDSIGPSVAKARSRLLSFKDTLIASFAPLTSLGVVGIFDQIGDAFDDIIERIGSTNLGAAITGSLEGFVSGVSRIISGARVSTIFESIRDGAVRAQREVSNLRGGQVEVEIDAQGAQDAERKIVRIAESLEEKIGAAANSAGLKIDELFASRRVGKGLEEGLGRVQSSFTGSLIPSFKKFQEEANEILSAIGVDPIEIELPDLDTISLSTSGVDEARESFRNLEADARRAIRTSITEIARLSNTRDTTIQIRAEGVADVEREILSLAKTIENSLGEASDEAAADLSRLAVKVKVGGFDSGVLKDISVGVKSFIDRASGDLIDFQNFANAELAKIGQEPIDFDFSALKKAREDLEKGIKLGTIDTGALEVPGRILDEMVKDLRDAGLGIGDIEPKVTRLVRGVTGEFRNLSKVLAGEMALSKTVTGATYAFIEARIKLAMSRAKDSFRGLVGTVRSVAASVVGLIGKIADGSVAVLATGVQAISRLVFGFITEFVSISGAFSAGKGLLHAIIFGQSGDLQRQVQNAIQSALNATAVGEFLRADIASSLTDLQVRINPTIDFEDTELFAFNQRLTDSIQQAMEDAAVLRPKIELKQSELNDLQNQLQAFSRSSQTSRAFRQDDRAVIVKGLDKAHTELEALKSDLAEANKLIAAGNAAMVKTVGSSARLHEQTVANAKAEADRNLLMEIGFGIQEALVRQRLAELEASLEVAQASGRTVEADKIRLQIAAQLAKAEEENTRKVNAQLDQISRFPSRIRAVLEALTEADEDQQNAVVAVLRAQKDLLKSEEDSATVAKERLRLTKELLAITQQLGLSTAETSKLLETASPFNQPLTQVTKEPSEAKRPPVSVPPPLDTSTLDAINQSLRGEFSEQNVQLQTANKTSDLIKNRLDSPFKVIVDQAFVRRIQDILSERGITPGVGGFVGDQKIARGQGIIPLEGGFPLDLIRDIFEQTTIGIEDVGLSAQTLLESVRSLKQEVEFGEAPGRRVGQQEGFQITGGQVTGISPNAVQSDVGQTILKSLAGREAVLDLLDSQGLQLRHLGLLENRLEELVGLQKQQLAADAAFDRDFGKGAGGTGAGGSTLQGVRRKDVNQLTDSVKALNNINAKLLAAEEAVEKASGKVTEAEQSGASQLEILGFQEKLEAAEAEVAKLGKQSEAAGESLKIVTQGNKAFTGLVEEFAALGKIDLGFLSELSDADLKQFGQRSSGAIADADLRQLFKDAARGSKEALDTIAKAQEVAKQRLEEGKSASASSTEQLKSLGEAAAAAADELNRIAGGTGEEAEVEVAKPPTVDEAAKDLAKGAGDVEPGGAVDEAARKIADKLVEVLPPSEELQGPPVQPERPKEPAKPTTPGSGFTKPGDLKKPKDPKLDTKKVQKALQEQIDAVKQGLEKQLQDVLTSQEEITKKTKEAIDKQGEMVTALENSMEAIGAAEEKIAKEFVDAAGGFEELSDEFVEFGESVTGVLEKHEVEIEENRQAIIGLDIRVSALGG